MPPLYPVHPRSQAGAADGPAQASMQYQNNDLLMEHLGSGQFNGQKSTSSVPIGLEYKEHTRDAISINDEGKQGNSNFPHSPPTLS